MNRMLLSWVLVFAAVGSVLGQETDDDWDARVNDFSGEVWLIQAGENEPIGVEKDMPLQAGDRIKTGPDSSAEIALDDGGLISLRADSELVLTGLRRSQSIFELSVGQLLAKIRTLLKAQSLQVRTPAAVLAVRGTEFAVEVPPDSREETYVGVFDEGKVEVLDQEGGSQILGSNQETKILRGQRPFPPAILSRFKPRRNFVRAMRRRVLALKKQWRPLAPEKRGALRRAAVERRKEFLRHRRQDLERRKTEAPRKFIPKKDRPDQQKMEKFREEIRRRRRQSQP